MKTCKGIEYFLKLTILNGMNKYLILAHFILWFIACSLKPFFITGIISVVLGLETIGVFL